MTFRIVVSLNIAVCLWLTNGESACAQQTQAPSESTVNEPTVKELLARIEKLEQRIRELESATLPQTVYQPVIPQAPAKALGGTYPHNVKKILEYKILRVPGPFVEQEYGKPGTQIIVPTAPLENVPSTWRRHPFNGHFYYTIPLSSSTEQM